MLEIRQHISVGSNVSLIDSSFFHLVGDDFLNIAGSGLFGDEDAQSKIVLI